MYKFLSVLTAVVLLVSIAFAGNFLWSKNSKPMPNLAAENNLQKKGVFLKTPSDADFDAEIAAYTKADNETLNNLIAAEKPFTVLVKNNSDRNIVGISLRWVITDADGNERIFPQSESTPNLLMGGQTHAPAEKGGKSFSLMPAHSSRFFSLDPSVQATVRNESRAAARGSQTTLTAQMLGRIQENIPNLKNNKEKLLAASENISVSIDGVVFEDGTFVGNDKNFFLAGFQATIQARKDFTKKIQDAGKLKKNASETFAGLQSLASDKPAAPEKFNSETEKFDYTYKIELRNLAEEALRKKQKLSESEIIEEITSRDTNGWTRLSKEAL
jgi:uncharacterized protein affecting Mg2+/Co2+ transport